MIRAVRQLLTIPRAAAAVWLSWGTLLILTAGMLFLRVKHPHFLPVLFACALLVASGSCLAIAGITQLNWSPSQTRAFGQLLVGVTPLLLAVAHMMYALTAAFEGNVRIDTLHKLLVPFGESLIDFDGRIRYPQQTEGEKVVMFSATSEEMDQETVANADAYIRSLEQRLGRPIDGRIHWFRGPVFYMYYRSMFGVCMGTKDDKQIPQRGGLYLGDRYVIAMYAINSISDVFSEPPKLLLEGFAQACSDDDEYTSVFKAWKYHTEVGALSLRELTSPEWECRFERPADIQGAAFVNFLIKTYGNSKFLDLYLASRRGSFASDCLRILGTDIDELDRLFWQDVEHIVATEKPMALRRLETIPMAPEVDRLMWKQFIERYHSAMTRHLASFRTVRLVEQRGHALAQGGLDPNWAVSKRSVVHSGDCWGAVTVSDGIAVIAAPSKSSIFVLDRPTAKWKPVRRDESNNDREYRSCRRSCRDLLCLEETIAPLLSETIMGTRIEGFTLVQVERVHEGEQPLIRVVLEWDWQNVPEESKTRQLILTFADDRTFALRTLYYHDHGETHDGVQSVEYVAGKEIVHRKTTENSKHVENAAYFVERVIELDPEDTPAHEFLPEKVLEGNIDMTPAVVSAPPPRKAVNWKEYDIFALFGAATLVIGSILIWRFPRERSPLSRSAP